MKMGVFPLIYVFNFFQQYSVAYLVLDHLEKCVRCQVSVGRPEKEPKTPSLCSELENSQKIVNSIGFLKYDQISQSQCS